MSFKLNGTVIFIGEKKQLSEKFAKVDFAISTQDIHPQKVLFQLTNDKCFLADKMKLGMIVDVSFNVRGREWKNSQGETTYFNSLEAWNVNMPTIEKVPYKMQNESIEDLPVGDLPF